MLDTIVAYARNFLKGNLTYTVAWSSITWVVFGYVMGYIDMETASTIGTIALGTIGIRRNMPNKGAPGRPTGT